jgi:hypothetical protein
VRYGELISIATSSIMMSLELESKTFKDLLIL